MSQDDQMNQDQTLNPKNPKILKSLWRGILVRFTIYIVSSTTSTVALRGLIDRFNLNTETAAGGGGAYAGGEDADETFVDIYVVLRKLILRNTKKRTRALHLSLYVYLAHDCNYPAGGIYTVVG